MVKLHDLQLQYCGQQCARARTPSHNSAHFLVPECTWHMMIMDGLLTKASVPMVFDDSTDVGSLTGSAGLQTRAATDDAVVQAFLSIAQDSALGDYFLKNLVRHICGFEEEDLVVLAMGVLSHYRWLRAVASRQSPSFAASQFYAVVSRVRELRQSSERSVGTNEETDFMRVFTRDLECIADILRFSCLPKLRY
jgi:hypothetical protein